RDFGQIPVAELPLTTVADPPFSRDAWTHVVVTFDHFNTGLPDGTSAMYLNGQLAGEVGPREQTFTWDPKEATIVLGINYVGLFDELALFSRPLTANEVRALFESPDMLHTP